MAGGGYHRNQSSVAPRFGPDGPQMWRPRRAFHNRNIAILVAFGLFTVAVLVLMFSTAPSESRPAAPTPSPTEPALVDLTPPTVDQLMAEGACTMPPSTAEGIRVWLRAALDAMLSFGTRVAGSNSDGYVRSHRLITTLATCGVDPADVSAGGAAVGAGLRYWGVWHDNFTEDTVIGTKRFSNIIAEMNHPPAASSSSSGQRTYGPGGHLVLAAHFDSMLAHNFEFLGACDSASPVVMLLLMMRELASDARARGQDATVYDPDQPAYTVVFLDGEEAFVEWKGTDNTYGARHLAALLESRGAIGSIDLFLLLDLLGPKGPQLRNYFPMETGSHFSRLRAIETSLRQAGRRRSMATTTFFPSGSAANMGIQDDHIPFLQRGVPILHMIPVPFPASWHKATDDGTNIDDDTAADLYDVFLEFARTYNKALHPRALTPSSKRRRSS